MSLFRNRPANSKNLPVQLTGLGRQKAEKGGWSNIEKVLTSLQENGPSSVNEIAEDTKMPRGLVETTVRKCIRRGYCKAHGGETED